MLSMADVFIRNCMNIRETFIDYITLNTIISLTLLLQLKYNYVDIDDDDAKQYINYLLLKTINEIFCDDDECIDDLTIEILFNMQKFFK